MYFLASFCVVWKGSTGSSREWTVCFFINLDNVPSRLHPPLRSRSQEAHIPHCPTVALSMNISFAYLPQRQVGPHIDAARAIHRSYLYYMLLRNQVFYHTLPTFVAVRFELDSLSTEKNKCWFRALEGGSGGVDSKH